MNRFPRHPRSRRARVEAQRERIWTDARAERISRGLGFVEMPDTTETQAAMAGLQGAIVGERTVTVNKARPREERREPRRPRW
jgi:RNA recognition motif-containing protein